LTSNQIVPDSAASQEEIEEEKEDPQTMGFESQPASQEESKES